MKTLRTLAFAGTLLLAGGGMPATAATFAGVDVPPPLPPVDVVDTHRGTRVPDPYRQLEDTRDPIVARWIDVRIAAKTASRLDCEDGHASGATRAQGQERTADRRALLLRQFGDPAFQPPP